jgi:hypothetical protein
MTVSVKPSACPTVFDHAFMAACFAGWPWRPAFDAVTCMLAHGMSTAEVERAFLDAARRVQ